MRLARAFLAWLAIIVAESIHGAVRRVVFGDSLEVRQFGVLAGAIIVLAIALLTTRQIDPRGLRDAFAIGIFWVALTVAFDVVLGHFMGANWQRIASDFDLTQGSLLPLGLAVMFFAPAIARALRRG